MLFPTSLVGSYPQPDWLIDRDRLRHRLPPRVRARELWRVEPAYGEQAQRDATLLAIRAQDGTSTTRARCWAAADSRIRSPGSPARSAGGIRSRRRTRRSCGPAPAGPSR